MNSNTGGSNMGGTGGTGGRSQGNTSSTIPSSDREFMMKAAMNGMEEVQLGQLAAKQGSSDGVRQFGQQMVTDHTAANEKLMQLASTKGVTLPTALDSAAQARMTKLQGLTGTAFDRQYLKDVGVSEHEKAVKLFQKQSTSGKDPDISAFASATLPTIQSHLGMARTMSGGEATSGSNANANTTANPNMNSNTSGNMNSNSGTGTGGNMNSNTSGNMNSNSGTGTGGNMNSNTNSNRSGNQNRNSNSNGNANNGNVSP
jgi:putative membrane protein